MSLPLLPSWRTEPFIAALHPCCPQLSAEDLQLIYKHVDHLEPSDPYRQEVEEVKSLYNHCIASERNGPCPPVLALPRRERWECGELGAS